jgi:hypothetical protein
MLNATQTLAAADLLTHRPEVVPGTRAILNRPAALAWYNRVTHVMEVVGIDPTDYKKVNAFCDLAGVPD